MRFQLVGSYDSRQVERHLIFPFLGIPVLVVGCVVIYQMHITNVFVELWENFRFRYSVSWDGHF